MAGANSYLEAKAEMEKHFQFVAKEIGRDWKKLGRKLNGITTAVIEDIDDKRQSLEEKAYEVLVKWYQTNGQAGATKAVLIKALQEIGKTSIAEELRYCHNCREDGNAYCCVQDQPSAIKESLPTSIQESARLPLSSFTPHFPSFTTPPITPPLAIPRGFNTERCANELDNMLKYCQKTVADRDYPAFGHMLKILAHLQETNEMIKETRNSDEPNKNDEPGIAKMKKEDRIRSEAIEGTMRLIKSILSTEPERTRLMSDSTLRRWTSEIDLPPRSNTVGSGTTRAGIISSPILSSRNRIQSRDHTPCRN